MSLQRTYRMPCRHSRSATGRGPGDRSGQDGSSGSINAHKSSFMIPGRVFTPPRTAESSHRSRPTRTSHQDPVTSSKATPSPETEPGKGGSGLWETCAVISIGASASALAARASLACAVPSPPDLSAAEDGSYGAEEERNCTADFQGVGGRLLPYHTPWLSKVATPR